MDSHHLVSVDHVSLIEHDPNFLFVQPKSLLYLSRVNFPGSTFIRHFQGGASAVDSKSEAGSNLGRDGHH